MFIATVYFIRESLSTNTKSVVSGTTDFICAASLLAPQSVLSLAFTKAYQQLSPWTQLGEAARPLPLSNHKQIYSIDVRPKALGDVVEHSGSERR